jgi:hypothetical protein
MTAPNRPPREVVEFPPNIPVTLALKYAQGKTISNQYGERIMFTTVDNRVLFLDPEVAGQIEALGVNIRENFTITKQSDGRKDSPLTWKVARLVGEQPNGTMVVPALPAAASTAPVQRPGLVDEANALVERSKKLVDDYAAVLDHALRKYEGRVKPDEVRAIFLTAAIHFAQKERAGHVS